MGGILSIGSRYETEFPDVRKSIMLDSLGELDPYILGKVLPEKRKGGIKDGRKRKYPQQLLARILIGSILGAVAGIFFAPRSGKELRSKIKEKGSEVLEVLKDAEEIYKEAKTILEDARRHAEELKKDLAEVGQKVKEILVRGEEKEAEGGESSKEGTGEKEI